MTFCRPPTPAFVMMSESPLSRNRGLISDSEQNRLAGARVLVAGVGGVGGRVAETLTRLGVGTLVLADPDTFSVTNLNRQAAATTATLGRNKAEVVAELCRGIGTGAIVEVVREGITPDNVEDLVASSDLVIDGTDYTVPDVGLRLARTARGASVSVVLAVEIGFGVWHTVIPPDGNRFERLLGLAPTVTFDDLASRRVSVPLWRWVLSIPAYIGMDVLAHVEQGHLEAPAVAPAVELSAAVVSTTAISLLVGRRPPASAPRVHHFDARTGKAKTLRPSRVRFYL
ncbi:ThiF family adenylyltransferase, partial [Streptomyces collinus]|uniref:ThiF family adenylyltransferase n=10 Tax=Actinomycetota TaxID=201174 RepID=UPI0037964161